MTSHDEMARRRIESLETYLGLSYCATHSVHWNAELDGYGCPKADDANCFVSRLGVPQ